MCLQSEDTFQTATTTTAAANRMAPKEPLLRNRKTQRMDPGKEAAPRGEWGQTGEADTSDRGLSLGAQWHGVVGFGLLVYLSRSLHSLFLSPLSVFRSVMAP